MTILYFVIIGVIAGWVASPIVEGSGNGLAMNLVMGVIGALTGGCLVLAMGAGILSGLIASVVGSVASLVVLQLKAHRTAIA